MKFYTIKLPKFLGGFVRAILGSFKKRLSQKAPTVRCFFVHTAMVRIGVKR